jgi:subtilase family serine protease
MLAKMGNVLAQLAAALPVDLVPLPRTPGSTDPLDFCQSSQSAAAHELDVHVANQGSSPAPASTTHVDFANSGGVDMPTPALAPGASAIVQFAIPATCIDASLKCSFTIVVDSTNAVTESNETNNSAAGLCDLS